MLTASECNAFRDPDIIILKMLWEVGTELITVLLVRGGVASGRGAVTGVAAVGERSLSPLTSWMQLR